MSKKSIVGLVAAVAGLAIVLALGVGVAMMLGRAFAPPAVRAPPPPERSAGYRPSRNWDRRVAEQETPASPQKHESPAAPPVSASDPPPPPPPPTRPPRQPDRPRSDRPPPAPQPPKAAATPPRNPEAREALSRVGIDPAAEAVWLAAINDPGLPAEERKDLIEDLNEDGFPDPRNITEDDLPLIVSRIELIEGLMPAAIDEVNQAAFQEAHKDLMNMLQRLAGQ